MNRIMVMTRIVWLETLRRKEPYVLAILLGVLVAATGLLDAFGLGGSTRHVLDLGLLLAWVFSIVLALSMAGRHLPREIERGTIFVILAKPVSRLEWLLGKALGGWSAAVSATACFYLLTLAVVVLQGGRPNPATAVQAFALHAAALAVLSALALALSVRMTSEAALTVSAVFAAFLFLVLPSIPRVLPHADPAAGTALTLFYHALPRLDLFDLRQRLVHDGGPAPGAAVAGVLAYGTAWSAALLALAWLGFRRRRFERATA